MGGLLLLLPWLQAGSFPLAPHWYWFTGCSIPPGCLNHWSVGWVAGVIPLLLPALPLHFGIAPIRTSAQRLAGHIEAAFGCSEPIDILGFSMGGVIARTWIQLMGGHARTRRFLSLGSPQQGTLTAQPWPACPWLASLISSWAARCCVSSTPISPTCGGSSAAAMAPPWI